MGDMAEVYFTRQMWNIANPQSIQTQLTGLIAADPRHVHRIFTPTAFNQPRYLIPAFRVVMQPVPTQHLGRGRVNPLLQGLAQAFSLTLAFTYVRQCLKVALGNGIQIGLHVIVGELRIEVAHPTLQ